MIKRPSQHIQFPSKPSEKFDFPDKLVIYDGCCNLCSYWVKSILNHHPEATLQLVSHLSALGSSFLEHHHLDATHLLSVIYYKNQRLYFKSDAVIEIAQELNGVWKLLRWLRWLPKCLRDALYMGIARNRYRWFGRKQECSLQQKD